MAGGGVTAIAGPAGGARIRVLLVDDHTVVRQGLRLLLEAAPDVEVVGEAADGAAALREAAAVRPDVILLDLLMPGLDGIETLRRLRAAGLPGEVLVLTASLDDHLVAGALQAGARGYALKVGRPADLVEAVRRVARGEAALDPAAARALVQQLRGRDPLAGLTPREREVFDALARGLNNPQIAAALHVSEATVRTHTASVLDKLELPDRTQVTIYALKRGLLRVEDLP
jgi:NarL family two-component system response regulator LiaR